MLSYYTILFNIGLPVVDDAIDVSGGGGTTRRHAWDLKGKVSDMENKVRNYQTKVKSVNEENEVLRGTIAQSKMRGAETEKELERQRGQIRYKQQFLFKHLRPQSAALLTCLIKCLVSAADFREYLEELQLLSGVRDELEKVSSDRSALQKELSNLESKYKVVETLRDSQETELQTLKV